RPRSRPSRPRRRGSSPGRAAPPASGNSGANCRRARATHIQARNPRVSRPGILDPACNLHWPWCHRRIILPRLMRRLEPNRLDFLMSRITVAQLEAFFWTASFGSMERASTHLNLSQPSISLRVRALEEQLGFKLFERAGRGLPPSVRGQNLLPPARRAIEVVQAFEQLKDPGTIRALIRLDFAAGVTLVCLGEVVERLRLAYPDLQPALVIETSPHL